MGYLLPLHVIKNKMSLFLRSALVKRPVRTISCVKRFYPTSHGFTSVDGLGIRYFIPRTADTHAGSQSKRTKDRHSLPEGSHVIYTFPHEEIFGAISFSALFIAGIFIFVIYDVEYFMELTEIKKEEENEPTSEELALEENYAPSERAKETGTWSQFLSKCQRLLYGPPRAKALIGLAMIIYFFHVRSRCVLKIYRHSNEYTTILYQALGIGKEFITHKASDGCYYPERNFFTYNLKGRNVIIFSDLFINSEERELYTKSKNK